MLLKTDALVQQKPSPTWHPCHCSGCKNIYHCICEPHYGATYVVLMQRGKGKERRNLETATNLLPFSHCLKPPSRCAWLGREAKQSLHHGQGKNCWASFCSPQSSPAPQGSLARGGDWGRREGLECPGDSSRRKTA